MNRSGNKNVLFMTHSTVKAGGSEDDFDRLIGYFNSLNEYNIDILAPNGERFENFRKYKGKLGYYLWGFFPVIFEGVLPYIKYAVKSIIQLFQMHFFVGKKKYDLCLLNVSVLLTPLLYFRFKNFKTIIFVRETVEPKFIRKMFYRTLDRYGTYFIAVSISIEKDFKEFTKSNKIETLYSSVEFIEKDKLKYDDKFYEYYKSSTLEKLMDKSVKKFLTVGEIGKRKNQKLLLESLVLMRNKQVELPLIFLAGKNDLENAYCKEVQHYIEQNQLNDNCVFLGELERDIFVKTLNLMDSVLIPSLSEGMPLTVADSFMMGKPIISSFVGGVPEVVFEGYNGYLSEITPEAFAEKMILINNDTLLKVLSANAFESYSKYFDLNRNLTRLKNIFTEL